MNIGLHDADKENLSKRRKIFPNYALMKISAYHKSLGDNVEWWDKNKTYDRGYSSKVFGFTPENPDLPPDKTGVRFSQQQDRDRVPFTLVLLIGKIFIKLSQLFFVLYLTSGCLRS